MPAADSSQRTRQCVLVHLPEPEPPTLVDRPPERPARGDEFPSGWKVADYNLALGEYGGRQYDYEVWVVPLADG